jgi:hypothetical protein
MSLKPNPKEINIILYILKGAQFEFLPRAPFCIDTPLPWWMEYTSRKITWGLDTYYTPPPCTSSWRGT